MCVNVSLSKGETNCYTVCVLHKADGDAGGRQFTSQVCAHSNFRQLEYWMHWPVIVGSSHFISDSFVEVYEAERSAGYVAY